MDITQAAQAYNAQIKGVNLETGVPAPEAAAQTMQSLVDLARRSDMPADGRFSHLDQVVGAVAELAPQSAEVFNRRILEDPKQREFAKSLETALAAMEQRSPETWQHSRNVTALSMAFYERQGGLSEANKPADEQELLTLFTGALGHDIGKLGLDPELLHKSTRVAPERFDRALQNYRNSVPDYPQKLHDTLFLEEANRGRILFADPVAALAAPQGDPKLLDIGKDMRRSEEYWVNDAQRREYNAVWDRINAHAQASLPPEAWLNAADQKTLTMSRRGTVTPEEKRVIESHDAMSEAFFKAAPVPAELKGVEHVVSMDRFRTPGAAAQGGDAIANTINTVDVFESITGNRSYRRPYTVKEAETVMNGMAREGKVSPSILASLGSSGAIDAYAEVQGMQHSPDLRTEPVRQASVPTITIDIPQEDSAARGWQGRSMRRSGSYQAR